MSMAPLSSKAGLFGITNSTLYRVIRAFLCTGFDSQNKKEFLEVGSTGKELHVHRRNC
jgi:hypothetical protein